jgi:hypothetical protein
MQCVEFRAESSRTGGETAVQMSILSNLDTFDCADIKSDSIDVTGI